MRIIPNPLVASFKGSAGEATAASWLGRNYIRKKVIPRNPQTPAQTAVRDSMARMNQLWQSIIATYWHVYWKSAWDFVALRSLLKGWNHFTHVNRALEQAGSLLVLMPDTLWTTPYGGPVIQIYNFAAVAGASGVITSTWTTVAGAGFTVHHYVRKAGTNLIVLPTGASAAETAETASLSGLTPAATYQVYAMIYRDADGRYGQADAKSSAAGA